MVPGLCHLNGMMEYWNNVLKTYNFSLRIKVLEINFHYLPIILFNAIQKRPNIPVFQYSIIPIVSEAN